MMKSMIAENGVTFKELEKNIYSWVCEIGRQFTTEFLERYDKMLMEERDKSKYRHKGLRQTTVKTVYGEVTYQRIVYEVLEEDGLKPSPWAASTLPPRSRRAIRSRPAIC